MSLPRADRPYPVDGPKIKSYKKPPHPDVEGLRMALMAIERVTGKPIQEIANKYATTPATVKKAMDLAAEAGFLDHYRALALDQLIPKALAVYEAHLALGSLEAARDVVHGLGVFSKAEPMALKARAKLVDSLDAYRKSRREKTLSPPYTIEALPESTTPQ